MAGSGLYRLYVGSLSADVSDDDLMQLFQQHQLSAPLSTVIKPAGYAFVECPDQHTFDSAIEQLNGSDFKGSIIQVEASTVSKRRRTCRIQILNIPHRATREDIDKLITAFGQVQRCDIVTSNQEVSVYVTYEMESQAQQAVQQLTDFEFQGSILKPDFSKNNNGNKTGDRNSGTIGGYPVRLLVPSDFVGAIIGKKGATIRRITAESKARIDVHREISAGLLEKVISLYGTGDQCSEACKQIVHVMQQEAEQTNRQEVALKLLSTDRYCGRIIGKEGKIIKKLREETESKISVSNVQELPMLFPDRVITIRGGLDNISAAEVIISAKLRECYEKDLTMTMPHTTAMMSGMMGGHGGGHGGGAVGGHGGGHGTGAGLYGSGRPYSTPLYGPSGPSTGVMARGGACQFSSSGTRQRAMLYSETHPAFEPETIREEVLIKVPNSAVGALIGAGGSHIKHIIRESNAFVAIESRHDDVTNPAAERTVTLKGNHQAKCKASYMIFEKLQKDGFAGNEELRLRTAIYIPRNTIGRVIGKKGNNVREVQRLTGAMIKIADDRGQSQEEDHAIVEIYGTFMQTNMAQNRLRSLLSPSSQAHPGAQLR